MKQQASQPPSNEELRFRDAMRRILSLTPEQREEVKRKVAEEAEKPTKEAQQSPVEETPRSG